MIDNKIGILLGLTTCDQYNVHIETRDNQITLKDHKEGEKTIRGFRSGNHLALPTQPLDKSRNEKAPEGSPTSWKNSTHGKLHTMYVSMLQNCKEDVEQKLRVTPIKEKIWPTDQKVDSDSDSEEEYMDAIEEIQNPKTNDSLFNTIKTGYQAIVNKLSQLNPLGDNTQNSDVTLECKDHKKETQEVIITKDNLQSQTPPQNADSKKK